MTEELIAGQDIGPYKLVFRLGKGGMGEVWAAAHNATEFGFQKLAAVKILRTKELTSNAAKMFFDEARAASVLRHEAIVGSYELGQDGEILYIGMDLIRGPSLTALLQRLVINKRTMDPAVVVQVGIQIASALEYANEKATLEGQSLRLVHRDVSPHNVLLDVSGTIRLTDFGVARTTIQTHESHVGTVRGKPSYMAPEQVVGADIDTRTDLFSLGIVLWECSSLKRLFGRSNPVKSMDAVIKHTQQPLDSLVPGFPVELSQVIERALKKRPEDRFQRPGEFVAALQEARRSIPSQGSVERQVMKLISENFDLDDFDVDGRVREILGLAMNETQDEVQMSTRTQAVTELRGANGTYVGMSTKVAWPTTNAQDPLAPEAIEEARTQYTKQTQLRGPDATITRPPSSISSPGQTVIAQDPANYAPPPRRNAGMIAAIGLATATLAGVGGFLALKNSESVVVPATAEAPAPAGPTITGNTTIVEKTPEPAPAAPEERKPAPTTKTSQPRTPKTNTQAKAATEPPPAPKAPAESNNATKAQVISLLREVKRYDPKAASELYPALAEAGDDNVALLNELRSRARAILKAQEN